MTTILYPNDQSVFHFQYNIPLNYMRYSTPDHKIGFVSDDSEHLQANVSTLSTFQTEAKLQGQV